MSFAIGANAVSEDAGPSSDDVVERDILFHDVVRDHEDSGQLDDSEGWVSGDPAQTSSRRNVGEAASGCGGSCETDAKSVSCL